LENNLVAMSLFTRGKQVEFTQNLKVGKTVKVRQPASFTAQEFTTAISVQDAAEIESDLTIEKHYDVSFEVTQDQLNYEVQEFSEQLLEPAMVAIAQAVDAYVAGKILNIGYGVGTATDPPDALADVAAVGKALDDQKVPAAGRIGILDPQGKADFLGITQATDADKRGDGGAALRLAEMGEFMGIRWYMSQNIPSVAASTTDGNYVVNGAHAVGATSLTVATGTGTIKQGCGFTIAGDDTVYTPTADYAGGAGSISINPPLQVALSGSEAITELTQGKAAHTANFAGNPRAVTCALVAPAVPPSANGAVVSNRGLSVRVVRDYNITNKKEVISLDVYAGAEAQQPVLGTQVYG
jgi:hypothetical protein